jgi:hypothetical protein
MMNNSPVVKVNCSLGLGDPYVGVMKHVEAHSAHRADDYRNHSHDTRHAVITP